MLSLRISGAARDNLFPSLVLIFFLIALTPYLRAAAPSIVYQPKSQTVTLDQQAVFGVIADGALPLHFQWRKNRKLIEGATNDQIVLAPARFPEIGEYSVVVSNMEGTVISSNAQLSIHLPAGGELDGSFQAKGSINDLIIAVAPQQNGKVLIGGIFTTVNGANANRIARLNQDGSTDQTFLNGLSGANYFVFALAAQNDGKVLLGGEFTEVNGVSRNRFARLNADGSTDSGFLNLLSGANKEVYSIALQPDGKILIAGAFTEVNNRGRFRIARLNSDGSLDETFFALANDGVYSMAIQADGRILIGGDFTVCNGVSRGRVARLNTNGTLDNTFLDGLSGADWSVVSVCWRNDGKVLIAGSFTAVNGVGRKTLAQLNADGSLDNDFRSMSAGPNYEGSSIGLQSDGKILVGGYFTTVNGIQRNKIVRLNPDGALDPEFGNPFPALYTGSSTVRSMVVQSDDQIVIGGGFGSGVARLQSNGNLDTNFENPISGPNYGINAVAFQKNDVLIGGAFNTYNGSHVHYLTRLKSNGLQDPEFKNPEVEVTVNAVVVQKDDRILIGGYFSTVNGSTRNGIARLNSDGTLDPNFLNGLTGADRTVFALALQKDGKVILGGQFCNVNGASRSGIARLNPDGSLDTNFLSGLSGLDAGVQSLVVQDDGKILLGGPFTTVNGVARSRIARLNTDGSLDDTFQNNLSGADNSVNSIALQKDGKVLIAGTFTTVNDIKRYRIARLNADGTLDGAFQDGLSGADWTIYAMGIDATGKILLGGAFSSINGVPRNRIAQLNADGTLDTEFQSNSVGADNAVIALAMEPNGKAVLGGYFTSINGVSVTRIARLWTRPLGYIETLTSLQDGNAILSVRLSAGTTNRVQAAVDPTNWTDVSGDIITGASEVLTNITVPATGPVQRRFYRLRQLP